MLSALLLALGVSASALAGSPFAGQKMEPIAKNGLVLDSVSYWPFYGSIDFHYPDDVLWGFYPEDASLQSVNCAEASYDKLAGFIENVPHSMVRLMELEISTKLYLWVNDYSKANETRITRNANFWFWSSLGDHKYQTGHWVWETTLLQDGKCLLPSDEQIYGELEKAWNCIHKPNLCKASQN